MSNLIRFKPLTVLAFTGLTVSSMMTGCNKIQDAQKGLCCTSFQVGADMSGVDFGLDGDIKGQFQAFAQAGSDLSVVATGALSDVSVACENIAHDLGADPKDMDKAAAMTGADAMKAWCDLATGQIKAKFGATGELKATLKVDFQPPVCTASVDATAHCEGGCSADAECDASATPPKCTGGKLTVECNGTCEASAGASVSCTGSCMGGCTGSCSAQGGVAVDCNGKCDGTCSAAAKGMATGSGTGIQADGTCEGQCDGTCTMKADAPAVTCKGTCQGSCDASCKGSADAKFTCDGSCTGTAEAPKCEGGKLELDCKVDADCKANCEASASAKAECKPPSVNVVATASGTVSADAQAQIDLAVASLKANLPNLLVVFKARADSFAAGIKGSVKAGANLTANVGDLSGEAVFCLPAIVGTIGTASDNFAASLSASGDVVASAGVK